MAKIRFFLNEKGSVLVMVLWVLALLTMIVAYYASQVKIMRNAAQYVFATTQGREAAMSILRLVATHFQEAPLEASGGDEAQSDGAITIYPNKRYITNLAGMEISFSVENEAGKIDLNRVDEGLLRDFLRYLLGEVDPIKADTIVDGILDWKDGDKLARINGAEDNVYMEKVPPYHTANRPFKTISELRLINGVTDRIFFGPLEGPNVPEGWKGGLLDLFTIYNGTNSVNTDYAPMPIKAFFEDKSIEGTDQRSKVWLLKVDVGHRVYKLYFSLQTQAPGYSLKFYTEGMEH